MKLKYFSLLFSFVGIILLYFLSMLTQPPVISIEEIANYQDKQVIIKGIVSEYSSGGFQTQQIIIKGNNQSVTIFLEGNIEVEYGDEIQAMGDVEKYKDGWEIIVNSKQFIKILKKWDNLSFPLWQLAENPLRYQDLNVNVTGFIESISNTNFYLVDLENKYSIIVYYISSKNVTIFPGQKVNVLAKFTFDEKNFRYQLEIFDKKHKIFQINEEKI